MSEKETAQALLDSLPDEKMGYAVAFLRGLYYTAEGEPNEDTLEAFAEIEEMKRTGGGQHFAGSTEELFEQLMED